MSSTSDYGPERSSAQRLLDQLTAAPAPKAAAQPQLSYEALAVAKSLGDRQISPAILGGTIRAAETLALVAAGLVVMILHVDDPVGLAGYYGLATIAAAVIYSFVVQAVRCYDVHALRHPMRTIWRLWLAWAGVIGLFALAVFFGRFHELFSRVWLAGWLFSGATLIAIGRVSVAALVRGWTREHRLERRAVLIGGGPAAETLIHQLEAQTDNDIRICGVFDDRRGDRAPPVIAGHPVLGTIAELVEFGRVARLDMLIVTLPITAEARVLQLLRQLWVLPVDIRLAAHSSQLKFRPRSYSYVGGVPFIDVVDKPLADWDAVTKRVFDLFFGIAALVALSPVMLAAAAAIKLDSKGPVFFRQKRYGFNNELIDVWKFRSMYTDKADLDASKLVTKGDPRVTPVGRFIRRTSIDELPQLFNVVLGNLSLVGPRPHAVSAKAENRLYEQVVDSYFARHRVKPGVTGWAQINGWRGETDTAEKIEKRVEYDLHYIENWSVTFDLYILFATPLRLLNTENAY